MRVAERYVNKELFSLFLFILSFLLLVVVGGRFLSYLEEASLGLLSSSMALLLIVYRLPEFVQVVAPFAVFFAVLLTCSRLYAESEMAIFQSAGVGAYGLAKWFSISIVTISLVVAFFSLLLTPKMSSLMEEFLVDQRKTSSFEMITPGDFLTTKKGTYTIYTEDVSPDGDFLQNIFVFEESSSGKGISLWARRGEITIDEEKGTRFLHLLDGIRYEGRPGRADYRVMEFQSFVQEIEYAATESYKLKLASTQTLDLDDSPKARGEFHWRIGLPIFCCISGFLALGLSKTKPRQGRYARVVPAAFFVFSYYLLLLFNHNALTENSVPTYLGLWLVHLLYAGLTIYSCYKIDRPSTV